MSSEPEPSHVSETKPRRKPFSADEKITAVLRLLRGEDRGTIMKELDVSADRLAKWEATFLGGGRSAIALSMDSGRSHRRRQLEPGIIAAIAAAILGLILVGVIIYRFVYQGLPAVPPPAG
jgi:transposase-like protein